MKVKIKGADREYDVQAVPPYMGPFNLRLSNLLRTPPKNVKDAETISAEIKELQSKLLKECVTPEVPQGDMLEVYNALMNVTKAVLTDADSFRKNK